MVTPTTTRILVALAIIVVNLTGCASPQPCRGASCTADVQTEAHVRSMLAEHAALGPPDQVVVRTVDHVVYLYGLVDTEMERELAQSVATGAAGGDRVVSLVSVYNR